MAAEDIPPQAVAQGTVWAEGPFHRKFRGVKGFQVFEEWYGSVLKSYSLGEGPCHGRFQGGKGTHL